MSLEKGFPTIGLLCDFEVFNTNKSSFFNRERFHLQVGSATSMDVALERCFTELFQNDNENDARMKESKRQIMQIDKVYESWPLLDELIPKRALFVTLYLRNGFFPSKYINFILDDRGTHSYWNYDDKDYLNEINSLFSLLNENKFHCYVKDYSWLGFPTLSIIVPELHFGYNEIDYEGIRLASFKKKILFDFNNLKKNDLQILNDPEIILRIISRIYNVGRFFQIEVPVLKKFSIWLFFGLLAKAFNLKEIAEKYFSQLLPHNNDQMQTAIKYKTSEEIKKFLKSILPKCNKSCDACQYLLKCRYPLTKKIQERVVHLYPTYFTLAKQ